MLQHEEICDIIGLIVKMVSFMEIFILVAEIIGTIAFTISGSMIAIERKMDLLGVILLGSVTAVGGGFLRDIILGYDHPGLFDNPKYCLIAVGTAIVVFTVCYIFKDISYKEKKWYLRSINVIDSIGLGIFVVIGAQITITLTNNVFLILFCAVLTGVGGGIVRDILACKIPAVFRKHIYAVAALVGGVTYYVLYKFAVPESLNIIICVGLVIAIRYIAYHYKLNLPRINLKNEC